MLLADRINALASAIGNHLRDAVTPRLIPPGGSTGQMLTKASSADSDVAWATPAAGGSQDLKPFAVAMAVALG